MQNTETVAEDNRKNNVKSVTFKNERYLRQTDIIDCLVTSANKFPKTENMESDYKAVDYMKSVALSLATLKFEEIE